MDAHYRSTYLALLVKVYLTASLIKLPPLKDTKSLYCEYNSGKQLFTTVYSGYKDFDKSGLKIGGKASQLTSSTGHLSSFSSVLNAGSLKTAENCFGITFPKPLPTGNFTVPLSELRKPSSQLVRTWFTRIHTGV